MSEPEAYTWRTFAAFAGHWTTTRIPAHANTLTDYQVPDHPSLVMFPVLHKTDDEDAVSASEALVSEDNTTNPIDGEPLITLVVFKTQDPTPSLCVLVTAGPLYARRSSLLTAAHQRLRTLFVPWNMGLWTSLVLPAWNVCWRNQNYWQPPKPLTCLAHFGPCSKYLAWNVIPSKVKCIVCRDGRKARSSHDILKKTQPLETTHAKLKNTQISPLMTGEAGLILPPCHHEGDYWNYRSFGRAAVGRYLRLIIRQHQPEFLCLTKTKIQNTRPPLLQFGFSDILGVPLCSLGGGFVVAWKRGVLFHVKDCTLILWILFCSLILPISIGSCLFVYGPSFWNEKPKLWYDLAHSGRDFSGPWLAFGISTPYLVPKINKVDILYRKYPPIGWYEPFLMAN